MASFIGMFKTTQPGAVIAKTSNAVGTMGMVVSEDVVNQNQQSSSDAMVTISNIDVSEGVITQVIIETQDSAAAWVHAGTFAVQWSGADETGVFRIPNVPFTAGGSGTGKQNFFRAYFTNSDGEFARDSSDIEISPSGTMLTDDALFNGIDDLAEYASVNNLLAYGVSDADGDGNGLSPTPIPNTGAVNLEWDDMRFAAADATHAMGDGSQANITTDQWMLVRRYVVYIFIATVTDGYPTPQGASGEIHPMTDTTPDSDGVWRLFAETTDLKVTINCPLNKSVGFWVGAVMGTQSSYFGDIQTIQQSDY